MKREAYLADTEVQSFLSWARPFVTGDRALLHQWSGRSASFGCGSLLDAYHAFDWRFRVQLPGESSQSSGWTLDQNFAVLGRLSDLLRQAAHRGDAQAFVTAANAVFEWGGAGVRQNRFTLATLEPDALTVVLADAARLGPERADLSQLGEVSYLNSGFSKIHALIIDDYPMYDSRVACALASMVRRYCEESGHAIVPQQLALSVPPSQGRTTRNPSTETLRFRDMRWRDAKQYATSNVIAAWLLGALAAHGEFGKLDLHQRLSALQSAMFMLGYRPVVGDASFPD